MKIIYFIFVFFLLPLYSIANSSDNKPSTIKNAMTASNTQDQMMVRVIGSCVKIENTFKRIRSYIFTFKVNSILEGEFEEDHVVFEMYYDFGGNKLLEALSAYAEAAEYKFNKDKQLELYVRYPPWFLKAGDVKRYHINSTLEEWKLPDLGKE